MPKVTIHCIRDAHGHRARGKGNQVLPDPSITNHGKSQCLDLQHHHFPISAQRRIHLIASSPLTRSLQTAYITFQPLLDTKHPAHKHIVASNSGLAYPKIVALPDAQETSDSAYDTGSSPAALSLSVAINHMPVYLGLLTPDWTDKNPGTRYSPELDALRARATAVRCWLRAKARDLIRQTGGKEDIEIVLVTHGSFLHFLTKDWEDAAEGLGTAWQNCEVRSYAFEADVQETNSSRAFKMASLVETPASRQRRGKKTLSMCNRAMQRMLFELAMESWEKAGLQRPDTLGKFSDDSDDARAVDVTNVRGKVLTSDYRQQQQPRSLVVQNAVRVSGQVKRDLPMYNLPRQRNGSVSVVA